MKSFGFLRKMIGLALVLVLSAACNSGQSATATPTPEKVSIQLSWVHEYSSASFYAAEKNGHFKEQGLDVSMIEGGFKEGKYIEAIDQVLSGAVDFGMSSAPSLIVAHSQGKGVVGVATILQRSPLAIISFAKSNIRRPQDLIGKKVAVAEGGAMQVYNSLLASQRIDPKQVNTVPRTTFGVEPLLKGEVDALAGWIINEGVQVREAGQEPSFMLMSDYGVDTYDFVLFTSEKNIKERPGVVERVVRAAIDGIKDVIKSPDQTVDYVLSYGKGLDKQGQTNRLLASIPLINPAGTKVGMMSDNNWESSYKVLIDQKILTTPLDYKTVYTLQFLNMIYGK